jgi:hypothetical protein
MNAKLYRQGDVLIMPIKNIPNKNKLKKTKRCTLALGEVTGHHHTIHDGAVGYADDELGLAKFVEVINSDGGALTHQEHDTIVLPEGLYKVIGQVEYTPERLRRVAD